MPTEYYHQIRRKFVIAVTIVILVLAGLFYWYGAREKQLVLSSAEKRATSYVSALREHADRVFSEADNSLKDLAEEIEENGGLTFAQTPHFYKILSDRATHFSSIYVVDKHADIIAHSLKYRMTPVNLAERDYFRYHRDNRSSGLFISKPFKSKVSGTWRFSLSRPLKDAKGEFAGLISVTFETSYFEKFYKTIDAGVRGRIILSTSNGDILVHEPFSEGALAVDFTKALLFTKYLPAATSGTYHVAKATISGTPRIISYNKLSSYPIVSIISFDYAEVIAPWLKTIYIQAGIGGALVLLFLALSWLFLRQVRSLGLANKVLEEQQVELELKADLLDAASDVILLVDDTGQFVYFNSALPAMTGYSREELQQRGLHGIQPPEFAARIAPNIAIILESGEAFFESAYLRKSGSILPIEVHAQTTTVKGQTLILSMVRDISERKEIEHQLSSSALEWQHTFDAVEDAVWLLDMDQQVVRANKASLSIFGRAPQEVVGLHCCRATYRNDQRCAECTFETMLATGKRASSQLNIDGAWYEVSVDPIFDEQGCIVRAAYIVKNINSLKRAEHREQVRAGILERIASGEALSQLLSFIAISIERENPEMLCSILLVNEDGTRLMNGAAPSLPAFYNMATHRTRIGEGIGSCGTAAFRRERVIVEDIDTHPFWKGFTPAQEAGLRSCWSEPILSSTGQLLGTFAIYHRTPAIPGDDEISLIQQASAFAGIAIERNKSEVERVELEHLLSQSQKMEAIGHLSGGIAHDFNNLLTPILIYSDMLKRSLPDNEKAKSQLDGIIKASGKARDLTQQLLSFGRKQVMQMQVVDLNDVIMSFHSMIRRTLRENISLSLQLSSQPVVVRADSAKIEQVLLNLVLNAQDAIAVNGSISFETGEVLIDDEFARRHPGMTSGNFVLLSCIDNGCGMNDETMARIFEPFFSTKEIGHGTGLGLANVYGIVKQHSGYVMAVSTVGVGTTFKIYLPVSDEKPKVPGSNGEPGPVDHSGSAVILLVEDNEMVRVMSCELLQGLGYTVYCADHPERALMMVESIAEKIDLVITDVVMPGMNGQQLFERITAAHPEINKVLYMSGYTNNVIVSDGELEQGLHFLQKPFTVDALMTKVTELLRPEQLTN